MIEVNPSGYENIPCLLEMEGVYQLGLKEIKLCQDLSAGPSFIVCTGIYLLTLHCCFSFIYNDTITSSFSP